MNIVRSIVSTDEVGIVPSSESGMICWPTSALKDLLCTQVMAASWSMRVRWSVFTAVNASASSVSFPVRIRFSALAASKPIRQRTCGDSWPLNFRSALRSRNPSVVVGSPER